MLLAKEGTPEHAAEAQSEQQGLNVRQGGGVLQSTERQAEQFRKMQPVQQPQQSHQAASMNYDSLPRPLPYPLEGDVIAYRLLHIGADWTPQVNLLPAPSFLPRGARSSTLYPACCMLQPDRHVHSNHACLAAACHRTREMATLSLPFERPGVCQRSKAFAQQSGDTPHDQSLLCITML